MEVWKIIFLSKWAICRFHVNLPGCTPQKSNIIYQELSYSKGTTFEQNNIILNIYVSFRGCITILSLRCWEKIVLLISLPCQSMQFPVLHYSRRKSSISRTYQDTLGFLLDLQKLTQNVEKGRLKTLHPPKQKWQWKITIFNRKDIFKWLIFHCHGSFREGISGNMFLFSRIIGSSPSTRSRSSPFSLRIECARIGRPFDMTLKPSSPTTWGWRLMRDDKKDQELVSF